MTSFISNPLEIRREIHQINYNKGKTGTYINGSTEAEKTATRIFYQYLINIH